MIWVFVCVLLFMVGLIIVDSKHNESLVKNAYRQGFEDGVRSHYRSSLFTLDEVRELERKMD